MADLRVPSLQHMARNWRADPESIAKALVKLHQNPPNFNYNPLFSAVRDLFVLSVPYDQVRTGIQKAVKRPALRKNFLEVLPLIRDYFEAISPDFVSAVSVRKYPIARGLMVPFEPPLLYGVGGRLYFPWLSFWRSNPLSLTSLSLFVSVVDEILKNDPDLEDAKFDVLDFSAPKGSASRTLTVLETSTVPRVSADDRAHMLEVFADGFFRAQAEIWGTRERKEESRNHAPDGNDDQPGLFD